jgi:hypothetical protein
MKCVVLCIAVALLWESRASLPKQPNPLRRGNRIGGNRHGNDGGPRPSRGDSWAGGEEPLAMESPMGGSWSVENAPSLSPDVEPESVRGGSTAESFTGNHSY